VRCVGTTASNDAVGYTGFPDRELVCDSQHMSDAGADARRCASHVEVGGRAAGSLYISSGSQRRPRFMVDHQDFSASHAVTWLPGFGDAGTYQLRWGYGRLTTVAASATTTHRRRIDTCRRSCRDPDTGTTLRLACRSGPSGGSGLALLE
jgi:hypothetical protein